MIWTILGWLMIAMWLALYGWCICFCVQKELESWRIRRAYRQRYRRRWN